MVLLLVLSIKFSLDSGTITRRSGDGRIANERGIV